VGVLPVFLAVQLLACVEVFAFADLIHVHVEHALNRPLQAHCSQDDRPVDGLGPGASGRRLVAEGGCEDLLGVDALATHFADDHVGEGLVHPVEDLPLPQHLEQRGLDLVDHLVLREQQQRHAEFHLDVGQLQKPDHLLDRLVFVVQPSQRFS